jgi:hypothetical protein
MDRPMNRTKIEALLAQSGEPIGQHTDREGRISDIYSVDPEPLQSALREVMEELDDERKRYNSAKRNWDYCLKERDAAESLLWEAEQMLALFHAGAEPKVSSLLSRIKAARAKEKQS